MAVEHVKVRGQGGYRWGRGGRVHRYDTGSESGKARAREAAERDGRERADATRDKDQRHRNEDDIPKPPPQARSRQLLLLLLLLWWADEQQKLEQRLALWAASRGYGRDGRVSQDDEGALLALTRRGPPPFLPAAAVTALAAAAAATSARRWSALTSDVVGERVAPVAALAASQGYAARLSGSPATVAASLQTATEKAIRAAAARGATVQEVVASLRTTTKTVRSRVRYEVEDGTNDLDVSVAEETQRAAGLDEYIWVTMGDSRVRREHRALDGKRQSWNSPPAAGPGGARAHPGQAPNCRCRAMPVANRRTRT
jgi:SPP1 gp7 family putative phage head morphogenesis protein